MDWLTLVHDILMVVLISMGLMAFSTLIVRAIGEEQRRNADHTVKILDKMIDKIVGGIKDVAKAGQEEVEKKQEKFQKEIDDLWKM